MMAAVVHRRLSFCPPYFAKGHRYGHSQRSAVSVLFALLFAGFGGCQQGAVVETPFSGEFQVFAEDSLELYGWFTPLAR